MVELLIMGRNTYMEDLTPQQIDEHAVNDYQFYEKYERRIKRGDLIEVGKQWIPNHFKRDTFVVLGLTNIDDPATVKQYLEPWRRSVTVAKITNDTTNHIYEYRITVNLTSISEAEKFDTVKDRFTHKEDLSIVSRSSTEVVIRFEPLKYLNVIDGTTTVEKRIERVEEFGTSIINNLKRRLRNHRYYFDLAAMPQAIKNALRDDGYYTTTSSNALAYLKDKSVE